MRENRSARLVFRGDPPPGQTVEPDETAWATRPRDPETMLLERVDGRTLERLMQALPSE